MARVWWNPNRIHMFSSRGDFTSMKQEQCLSVPRGFKYAVAQALRGQARYLYAIAAVTVAAAAAIGMLVAEWLFAIPV